MKYNRITCEKGYTWEFMDEDDWSKAKIYNFITLEGNYFKYERPVIICEKQVLRVFGEKQYK
jgi:hypothetical protein